MIRNKPTIGNFDPWEADAGRPDYPTPDDYVTAVADAIDAGRRPWQPRTAGELVAVAMQYPDVCRRYAWWPSEAVLTEYGIDPRLMNDPEPWGDVDQLRLVATLNADAEFAHAVRDSIGGAA